MIHILERLLKKKERKSHLKHFNRKLSLHFKEDQQIYLVNIHGAPKVGKTTWARLFSASFNMPLLIDCADPRIRPYIPEITQTLTPFIIKHEVDLLILDNLTQDLLILFNLEEIIKLDSTFIVILSEEKLLQNHTYLLKGIDFEEYMSFSNTKNPEQLFNAFLLDGTLPEILFTEESKKNQRKREILLLCHKNKPDLLISILSFMGQAITAHHLYMQLKKTLSISKDTLYSSIKQYEKQSMIFWLSKFQNPHAAKKLYFWDFSLFNAISYDRNFVALFENMIFLEINQTSHQLYYSDTLDFLIKKDNAYIGIIVAPFLSTESITKRMQKIEQESLELIHVFVVTLGNASENKDTIIPYTVLPFWEFALREI